MRTFSISQIINLKTFHPFLNTKTRNFGRTWVWPILCGGLVIFRGVVEHDDGWDVVVVNEAPKIRNCVRHRHLCQNKITTSQKWVSKNSVDVIIWRIFLNGHIYTNLKTTLSEGIRESLLVKVIISRSFYNWHVQKRS